MSERGKTRQRSRVLVVDDSRLILEMIYDFFTPLGFVVDAATSAEKALDMLTRAIPDVIIEDVLMPEMDGWEFFEQVRKQPRLSRIPIVFLTTETELSKRLRAFEMGADDYVMKPFAVEELHARVERILADRRALKRALAIGEEALLAGTVEHLALSDLLQMLALNGKDGIVELRDDGHGGRVVVEAGNIVHAECGSAIGEKALYRMLGWTTATFRVLERRGETTARTVQMPTTGVLMDGLVSLDEWNRWRPMLPPPEFQVEIASDSEPRTGPGGTRAEIDVMSRARHRVSVGEILEQSPLPDAELAEALCTLLTREVLRARD